MAAVRRTPRSRPADAEQPATAPLEPPQKSQTAPDAVEPVPTVNDTGVALIAAAVHPIVDQETGLPPVLDGLFVKLAEHSTVRVCTKRLLEHEEGGITKLLLCRGAQVSLEQAMRVIERLAAHAGQVVEAPVEVEVEEPEVADEPEVEEPEVADEPEVEEPEVADEPEVEVVVDDKGEIVAVIEPAEEPAESKPAGKTKK